METKIETTESCTHASKKRKSSPLTGYCPMSNSNTVVRPKRGKDPVYYHSYLELDKILDAQTPLSLKMGGSMAHDEMLFIVTHQTYELWFKQVLHDLDSILVLFTEKNLPDKDISVIVGRLGRVVKILKVLVDQIGILETMTPMSFLDFRDYLFPASGFQSVQFRLLENKLGLERKKRMNYSRAPYTQPLSAEHKKVCEDAETQPSLFQHIEKWLERTPFLKLEGFDFWEEYRRSVLRMLQEDRDDIKKNTGISAEEKEARLKDLQNTEKMYEDFFDEKKYNELVAKGKRRLSYNATKAAIMINLYREEPLFQLPYQLLSLILDVDSGLTRWRYHHAMMVHRMLGMKIGTGGSSGFHYLQATASQHKIFADFAELSMFYVPRSAIPKLPQHVRQQLRFPYDKTESDD